MHFIRLVTYQTHDDAAENRWLQKVQWYAMRTPTFIAGTKIGLRELRDEVSIERVNEGWIFAPLCLEWPKRTRSLIVRLGRLNSDEQRRLVKAGWKRTLRAPEFLEPALLDTRVVLQ